MIAVEPANADDAAQSFRAGRRMVTEKKFTIADGLRTNVGEPNFAIVQRYVDDIVTVSEEAIVSAMRTIWETMKIVIEPSAAVPYAAILERVIDCERKTRGNYFHRRQRRSCAVTFGSLTASARAGDCRLRLSTPASDAWPLQIRQCFPALCRRRAEPNPDCCEPRRY